MVVGWLVACWRVGRLELLVVCGVGIGCRLLVGDFFIQGGGFVRYY